MGQTSRLMEEHEDGKEDYVIDPNAALLECREWTPERLRVLVRWGTGGPEELEGLAAAEFIFVLPKNETMEHQVLIRLEQGAWVDAPFVRYVCGVYGVVGMVNVEVVRNADIKKFSSIRVR
jgi:hypothetical protein